MLIGIFRRENFWYYSANCLGVDIRKHHFHNYVCHNMKLNRKRKIQKYVYLENRNKKRIGLTPKSLQKHLKSSNFVSISQRPLWLERREKHTHQHMQGSPAVAKGERATEVMIQITVEKRKRGTHLRLILRLCREDQMSWYASSRWWQVIWSTHAFQQELKPTYIPT